MVGHRLMSDNRKGTEKTCIWCPGKKPKNPQIPLPVFHTGEKEMFSYSEQKLRMKQDQKQAPWTLTPTESEGTTSI